MGVYDDLKRKAQNTGRTLGNLGFNKYFFDKGNTQNTIRAVAEPITGIPTFARGTADAITARRFQPEFERRNQQSLQLDNRLIQAAQRARQSGNTNQAKRLIGMTGNQQNFERGVLGRELTTPEAMRDASVKLAGTASMGLNIMPKALQAARPIVKLAGYGTIRGAENAAPGVIVNTATGAGVQKTLKDAKRDFVTGVVLNTVLSPKLAYKAVGDVTKAQLKAASNNVMGTFGGQSAAEFGGATQKFSNLADKKVRFDSGTAASVETNKYKNADEFVNSQVNAYHGSTNNNIDSLIPGAKTGLNEKRKLIYLAEDSSTAANYAKNRGTDGTGLGVLSDSKTGTVYPVSVRGKVLGAYDFEELKKLQSAKGYENLSGKTKNQLTNPTGLSADILETNPELVEFLNSNGYTAVKAHLINGGGNELIVTNPSAIKTKSQLTEEWNKANRAASVDEIDFNDPSVRRVLGIKKGETLGTPTPQKPTDPSVLKKATEELFGSPASVEIPEAEIKRVAENLKKNNPGLPQTEADAIAKDVIRNREFNAKTKPTEAPPASQGILPKDQIVRFDGGKMSSQSTPKIKNLGQSTDDLQAIRQGIRQGGKVTDRQSFSQIKDDLETNLYDRFAPIKRLEQGRTLRPSETPTTLIKRATGSDGIANAKIEFELTPILREAKDDLGNLETLMVAERMGELASQGRSKSPGNALAQLQAELGPERFTKLQQTAEKLRAYQDKYLQEWKEVGGLSDEGYNAIKSANQKYVPFQRVLDDLEDVGFVSSKDLNSKVSPIKKLKGSDRAIESPLESIVQNSYRMQKAIEKQRSLKALIDLGGYEKLDPKMVPVATVSREGFIFPEVMEEVSKIIKQYGGNIERNLKIGGKGRAGYFQSKIGSRELGSLESTKLVTKFGTPKDVLIHEFGHLLDTKFNLKGSDFFDSEVSKELRGIADLRLSYKPNPSATPGYKNYTRKGEEKIAEFVAVFFNDPATAKQVAPKTFSKFQAFMSDKPELKDLQKAMKSRALGIEKAGEVIFRESQFEPKEPHITLFENGKKVYYSTPKEIADVMAGVDEEQLNTIIQVASLPARALRAGATGLNAGFAVPNVLRDQLAAAVNSKYGGIPVYDFVSGLASVFKKDEAYKNWLLSGADMATMASQDRGVIRKSLNEAVNNKRDLGKFIKNPLELVRSIGEYSEKGSRVGVFKRAQKGAAKEGLTGFDNLLAAGREAREATVDFSQRGAKMKAANAMIPFLNARIQGTGKLAQSIKTRPVQSTLIGTAIGTLPAATLYVYNTSDPERAAIYDEIPDYITENNFIIVTGGKETPFLKIPKGEIGRIFGNPTENFLGYMRAQDQKSFAEMSKDLLVGLSPVQGIGDAIPTVASVPMQLQANYDTFRKRNIVSPYQKDLPPELQFDKKTSETAKFLGNIVKMSPAKIEFALRGIGAGVAGQALQLSDGALFGKFPETNNLPVIDRFAGERKDLSKSAQKIYETEEKRKQAQARTNFAVKQHIDEYLRTGNEEMLKKAAEANPESFRQFFNDAVKNQAKAGIDDPTEKAILSLPKKQQEIVRQRIQEQNKTLDPLATTGQPKASAKTPSRIIADVMSEARGFDDSTSTVTDRPSEAAKVTAKLKAEMTGESQAINDRYGYRYNEETGTATFYDKEKIKGQALEQQLVNDLEAAYKTKDYAKWKLTAEKQYDLLEKQTQALDPVLDAAKILANQNKMNDLQLKYLTYKGYGGLSKPKKAKTLKVKNRSTGAAIALSKRKPKLSKSSTPKVSIKTKTLKKTNLTAKNGTAKRTIRKSVI